MHARSLVLFVACVAGACIDPNADPLAWNDARQRPTAASMLNAPLSLSTYLVGFHVIRDAPSLQIEAHHYCTDLREDVAQCAIFDGHGRNANLVGVEYVISEREYDRLPDDEKQHWHPHNYEILSGALVAPALADVHEKDLLKAAMNSYGKAFHFWNPASNGERFPIGQPMLAWSFNADGELAPDLLNARDRHFDIDTADKRHQREDLVRLSRPQRGVDTMRDAFPHRRPVEGIEPKLDVEPRPIEPRTDEDAR